MIALDQKSTMEEIRERFDRDVERFSKLDTGQETTMDAPLVLQLLRELGRAWLRPGARVLDLGCGAGNFSLALAQEVNLLDCTLVDLSGPMLARAAERVGGVNGATVQTLQGDMRVVPLPGQQFDLIVTGAALHHLRETEDWRQMFARLAAWLKPGGVLFVFDYIMCDEPAVQQVLWARYGRYLESIGGAYLRQKVFAYIEREDSPRSLAFQLEMLRAAGFATTEVLHRNGLFAAYYARKAV
jgi:tRNA (cmo5U34)-methyltransferase